MSSSDESVVRASLLGECGELVVLTGVGPGIARIDLANGGGREGWQTIQVAAIRHLAIAPSDAPYTARQDPPVREVYVGMPIEMQVLAYDVNGRLLRADDPAPTWESLDASVLTMDEFGFLTPVAPGETDVEATLLGGTVMQHIQVLPRP